jgi:hypothetical protein
MVRCAPEGGHRYERQRVTLSYAPVGGGLVFDATGTYRLSFFVLGIVMLLAILPAAFTTDAARLLPMTIGSCGEAPRGCRGRGCEDNALVELM